MIASEEFALLNLQGYQIAEAFASIVASTITAAYHPLAAG